MGDRLKEKVALVSGAGSSGRGWGNGKATAVLFAREGAKVVAADINLAAALETKRIDVRRSPPDSG
jgi:NAD(P)-dependent dehydrogenase (short-subunit alcohol dehydrogenase family)